MKLAFFFFPHWILNSTMYFACHLCFAYWAKWKKSLLACFILLYHLCWQFLLPPKSLHGNTCTGPPALLQGAPGSGSGRDPAPQGGRDSSGEMRTSNCKWHVPECSSRDAKRYFAHKPCWPQGSSAPPGHWAESNCQCAAAKSHLQCPMHAYGAHGSWWLFWWAAESTRSSRKL